MTEGIRINLISMEKLSSMGLKEKLRYILEQVKRDTVLVLEMGLTPTEEFELIKMTMEEIDTETFVGIEMQSYGDGPVRAPSWWKRLTGRRKRVPRMEVIGPAHLLRTVHKDDQSVEAMIVSPELVREVLDVEKGSGSISAVDGDKIEAVTAHGTFGPGPGAAGSVEAGEGVFVSDVDDMELAADLVEVPEELAVGAAPGMKMTDSRGEELSGTGPGTAAAAEELDRDAWAEDGGGPEMRTGPEHEPWTEGQTGDTDTVTTSTESASVSSVETAPAEVQLIEGEYQPYTPGERARLPSDEGREYHEEHGGYESDPGELPERTSAGTEERAGGIPDRPTETVPHGAFDDEGPETSRRELSEETEGNPGKIEDGPEAGDRDVHPVKNGRRRGGRRRGFWRGLFGRRR